MRRVEIIAGPTASGKSALALRRAADGDGVIVNADSMQIYAALPLLTAQPSPADMRGVPHRLYGVLPPDESCSARRWRDLAILEIEAALAEDKRPIVVGGTGFYINALLRGLSPMPDVPAAIRAESMDLQRQLGNPGFHARLAADDPVMAARLHPNDTQRLVRAWEIWRATGRSLSHWQQQERQGPPAGWRFRFTLALPERAALYARCDRRFDAMLATGALDEVRTFADAHPRSRAAVTHALGYRPLLNYLTGSLSRDAAVTLAKTETRQYAKRQDTWFRHQVEPAENIEITVID